MLVNTSLKCDSSPLQIDYMVDVFTKKTGESSENMIILSTFSKRIVGYLFVQGDMLIICVSCALNETLKIIK